MDAYQIALIVICVGIVVLGAFLFLQHRPADVAAPGPRGQIDDIIDITKQIDPLSREVIFSAQTRRGELALGGPERIVPPKEAPAFEQQLKARAEIVVWP
jgi:hypothetical protein